MYNVHACCDNHVYIHVGTLYMYMYYTCYIVYLINLRVLVLCSDCRLCSDEGIWNTVPEGAILHLQTLHTMVSVCVCVRTHI